MFKAVLVLAVIFVSPLAFANLPTCTQHIPVSASYYTADVVNGAQGCVVVRPAAYERAQMQVLRTCRSLLGHYHALAQRAVCADQDSILVEGECIVEGATNCVEQRQPIYWGAYYEN